MVSLHYFTLLKRVLYMLHFIQHKLYLMDSSNPIMHQKIKHVLTCKHGHTRFKTLILILVVLNMQPQMYFNLTHISYLFRVKLINIFPRTHRTHGKYHKIKTQLSYLESNKLIQSIEFSLYQTTQSWLLRCRKLCISNN